MFCTNCGKEIKEREVKKEKQKVVKDSNFDSNKQVEIVFKCPTCGELIHSNLSKEEMKSLNQVAHSKIHKARYDVNAGLCGLVIGLILIVIGLLFFVLCFDINNNRQLDVNRTEFYVFCVLFSVGAVLLTYGVIRFIIGLKDKRTYTSLVRHLQNETFVQ